MRSYIFMFISAVLTCGCTHVDEPPKETPTVDASVLRIGPYTDESDAMADVDAALARANERGVKAMVIMGANWCHDSLDLADRFDLPEFETLISKNYELVYVSVGTDPGQNDQNRAVSQRFGVEKIEGTPTVFIVKPDGTVLNTDSAGYWRKASGIPVDMSYAYFNHYLEK